MDPVKVILNPYAGRGRGGNLQRQIEEALQTAGLAYDIALTHGRGHAIELARQARIDGFATVAAAGGDGTVSEVVNGLALATPEDEPVGQLALLPVGSGNDFADMVGCPRNLVTAAKVIAQRRLRALDMARVVLRTRDETRLRYFDNNMGVGLEARVTLESYKIHRLQGTLLYVVAALRTLRRYQAAQMEVVCRMADGATWQRSAPTLLVTIGNSRRTGGGFYLTPDALMDDGLLDVGVAKAVPLWHALTLLPRALFGKHTGDPAITMLRGHSIHITCAEGIPAQLDGEVVAQDAIGIDVYVQPRRLHLLAPAPV